MTCRLAYSLLLGVGLLAGGNAFAQETAKKPHVPLEKTIGQVSQPGPVTSLAVLNADGARLEGNQLVLTGVTKSAILFSDRPVRAAGHVSTEEFIAAWGEGADSFASDPPNATVSVFGGTAADVSDAVVTLKSAKLDGTTLTFEVAVLEGSLDGADGPAAVFIDHWNGWRGAAWYGAGLAAGAAIGAGAIAPYYPAPYYPAPYYGSPCPPGYWVGPWGHCRDTPFHGRLPDGGWR